MLRFSQLYIPTYLRVALIVPGCIFLYVITFSYFFGGNRNLVITLASWFVIIPLMNVFLSKIISGKKNLAYKSLISLLIFYGIMVFMIYEHYQTDFFKIMIASMVFNASVMLLGSWVTYFDGKTAS